MDLKTSHEWIKVDTCIGIAPSTRLNYGQEIVEVEEALFMHVFGWRQPTNHDAVYDGSEAITSLSDA